MGKKYFNIHDDITSYYYSSVISHYVMLLTKKENHRDVPFGSTKFWDHF